MGNDAIKSISTHGSTRVVKGFYTKRKPIGFRVGSVALNHQTPRLHPESLPKRYSKVADG